MVRWAGWLLAVLWLSCVSERTPQSKVADEDTPVNEAPQASENHEPTPFVDKNQVVIKMEKRMHLFLGQAISKFEDILKQFASEIEDLKVPPKIRAVEKELADFYMEEEDVYQKSVQAIVDRYLSELDHTLVYLEPKVWEIAFQIVGSADAGVSYGSRTGIDEVDEIANATLELIHFRSGRDQLEDDGEHAKYKRIFMDRLFKNDVEGEGRLSIFVSDPMRHYFRKDEDAVAITVTYQKKGLDPDTPVEFRQIVRNRIVRGGTTRFDSKFCWDTTLQSDKGRLRIKPSSSRPGIVVSAVFYPRVNMDDPYFDQLRDYTAIRDYQTAAINVKTGEILDCISWQYKWSISHFGAVAVERGASPAPEEDPKILRAFLEK